MGRKRTPPCLPSSLATWPHARFLETEHRSHSSERFMHQSKRVHVPVEVSCWGREGR